MNPIDNECFLVGTLSDYMGREKYERVEYRVDKYSQSEKRLCLAIDSIFEKSYPDLIFSSSVHKSSKRDQFELHSNKLTAKIELFYTYKPSGRGALKSDIDIDSLSLDSLTKTKDFITESFDTIYTGILKSNMFETEQQKLSFITGAYVRFGGHGDSLYHISIANSVSKVRVLDEFLKDIGCANVKYELRNGYIPVGHSVHFKPTKKLKSYFEQYITLR